MPLTRVHPLCHTRSVQSKQRSEQEEGLRHFPHSFWEMDFDGEKRGSPLLQLTKTSGTATSVQTLGNIVVSILGTGILGLPYAFRIAGWLAGSVGILITGLAIYYCMLLLVSIFSLPPSIFNLMYKTEVHLKGQFFSLCFLLLHLST